MGWQPFTDDANRVIRIAQCFALERKQAQIRSSYLLLAIIKIASYRTQELLKKYGIDTEIIESKFSYNKSRKKAIKEMDFSKGCKKIIEQSFVVEKQRPNKILGMSLICYTHLLTAICEVQDCQAYRILLEILGRSKLVEFKKELENVLSKPLPSEVPRTIGKTISDGIDEAKEIKQTLVEARKMPITIGNIIKLDSQLNSKTEQLIAILETLHNDYLH